MKIDCVFSGGGVKAYAFLGVLEILEEKDLQIERVAGTSAGAIMAALISANYSVEEIHHIIEDAPLKDFYDAPIYSKVPLFKWISLYFKKGLYKGDVFEKWISLTLARKGLYTFGDVTDGKLKVIVSDISLGKLVVIPDDLERVYGITARDFPISTAIRMSAGFPYFFIPKKLKNIAGEESYIVDGGLLSNFPLWVFNHGKQSKRPVLGATLSEDIENTKAYPIHNAFDMFHAVFETMRRAHDSRYIAKSKESHIIFIPVKDIKTTDLSISPEEKTILIKKGREYAANFLAHWP